MIFLITSRRVFAFFFHLSFLAFTPIAFCLEHTSVTFFRTYENDAIEMNDNHDDEGGKDIGCDEYDGGKEQR